MRNLLNVVITLLLFVPLIHCGVTADMTNRNVTDKIECPDLDGAYKTRADLFFNFIPLNQSYNVNIASGGKDLIIQIESVEEKNIICTIFSDVKLATEDNSKLEFSSSESMVATTNSKTFGDTINSFHIIRFKDDDLDNSYHESFEEKYDPSIKHNSSCKIKELYVLKESYPSAFELVDELFRDTNRKQKSFETIKKECGRLTKVEADEKGVFDPLFDLFNTTNP